MKLYIASSEEMIERFIKSGNKRPKHILFLSDYKEISQLFNYKVLECYAYDLEAKKFIDELKAE